MIEDKSLQWFKGIDTHKLPLDNLSILSENEIYVDWIDSREDSRKENCQFRLYDWWKTSIDKSKYSSVICIHHQNILPSNICL